jgi:hypothetical protein
MTILDIFDNIHLKVLIVKKIIEEMAVELQKIRLARCK